MLDRGEIRAGTLEIPLGDFDSFHGQPFFPSWDHRVDGHQTRSDRKSSIFSFYLGTWRFIVDLATRKVELTSSATAVRPTLLTNVKTVKMDHQEGVITFIAKDRKDWRISQGGICHEYKGQEPFYLTKR